MRSLAGVVAAMALTATSAGWAQPTPPSQLNDTRLSVHTLVREDIFAGFLEDDAVRMARGEANLKTLLASRPGDRATVLVWQAGGELYHAVKAREAGKPAEYRRRFAEAERLWAEAASLNSPDPGVPATMGGAIVVFGDRLAPRDRPAAWDRAYRAYKALHDQQARFLDKMPPHHRGEVMAGLVQAAQRSGRQAEADAALDRMLVLVKDTPHEATALKWKTDPAARSDLACKGCHDAGRLGPSVARLTPR